MSQERIDFFGIAVLAGLGVAVYLGYEFVKHISLFDPTSQSNLANRGFNAWWQSLTGSQGTYATDLYNFFHWNQAPVKGPPGAGMCFIYDKSGALVYRGGVVQSAPCGTITAEGQALTAAQVRALRGGGA